MDASEVKNEWGIIRIADHALAVIAHMAALSVPGVAGMDDSFVRGFSSMITGTEDTEGVRISAEGNKVAVDLYISAEYGLRIPELALRLQEKVKEVLVEQTELMVTSVNVYVQNICFTEKQNGNQEP